MVAAVGKQVPAVEAVGTQVVGLAKAVGAEPGEFDGGVCLHRGPLGAVDKGGAVLDEAERNALAFVNAGAEGVADEGPENLEPSGGGEKIPGRDGGAEEVVVVEVEEPIGNSGEEVEVGLDDVAIEGGEGGGIGADLVVVDDAEARVIEAEPGGDLGAAGEEVNMAHPRGVEGEGAQAVAE